jgi:hemoglobin/transferrin/lactoferrin receptor protein
VPQGEPTPPAAVTQFDALSTSGAKAAETVYDAPATVTVKSAAEIDRQLVSTPQDLVRDEPGINFGNQPTRGGGTNYVIRGIGENRVRIEIDGVKVPDFPVTNIGSPTGYTRDFVDLEALKRVEIVRGPASALYGSDAIGGVVSYITKDPADYLALFGRDAYGSLKVGYDSADRSIYGTYTGAARFGAVETMALVTRREGHEVDINSKTRSANPQDYESTNFLGKIVYNTAGLGQFKLTGELYRKTLDTQLNSELGVFPDQFAQIFNSDAEDTNRRRRLSLEWSLPVSLWLADTVKSNVFITDISRQELTDQLRATYFGGPPLTSPTQRRLSDFGYRQNIYGADVQATARRNLLWGEHTLTYGVSADQTSTTRPRERSQITLATGAVTKTVAGETYPNKNFPDTDTTQAAFYIQDIARWGALRLIPAVRFDYYGLKVKPDLQFGNSNTGGFAIQDQTATAVSPKFGATFDLNTNLRLFGQYAHGFRAPPYDNANFGFRNPVFFYEILPNGNIRPETSDGYEAGLRGRFANGSSFQVSSFYNTYKDFIETVNVGTSAGGLTQFQYKNISNATIWGYEAKGELRLLPEWSVFGSLAYANGTNEETNTPLDSVDPWTGIAGVRYRSRSGWGGEVRAKYVAEKDRVSLPTIVTVPAHTTVDALVSYEVKPTFTFNMGVFNMFDASYFNPTAVAGVDAKNPNLELFRAPGRTFATNVTVRW